MSAARQPVDPEFAGTENWQSLVGDQGYRLFAAGNGSAVIVEGLPQSPAPGPRKLSAQAATRFDAQFGLDEAAAPCHGRFVLLTEVSRAKAAPRRNGGPVPAARHASPWSAVRTIQPLASLSSIVSRRSASQVFFLVRRARPHFGGYPAQTPRLDVSAVQIGRSLGLGHTDLEALRVAGLVCEMGNHKFADGSSGVSEDGWVDTPVGQACQIPDCSSAPVVVLDMKHYCRDHFIVRCYQQLDDCAEQVTRRPMCDQESEALRSFLRACIERATQLTRAPFLQDSLERARLLDIRYTATDLLRKMRRSPRVAEARPVLLRCETPGRPWEERLQTQLISRFGAMFECEHFIRSEDWLCVQRLDTGTLARARMAWRAPAKAGHFSVALEFVDADNFWDLNWGSVSSAHVLPS